MSESGSNSTGPANPNVQGAGGNAEASHGDGKSWFRIGFEGIAGIAAIWTALLATFAFVFSTPTDARAWLRINLAHPKYSVSISHPHSDEEIGYLVTIRGTARLPDDWALILLTQTPDELKYYIEGSGAVAINPKSHEWALVNQPFGRDPKDPGRRNDLNKPYKIFALAVDAAGQQQVQKGLSGHPAGQLLALPHYTLIDIVTVNLVR